MAGRREPTEPPLGAGDVDNDEEILGAEDCPAWLTQTYRPPPPALTGGVGTTASAASPPEQPAWTGDVVASFSSRPGPPSAVSPAEEAALGPEKAGQLRQLGASLRRAPACGYRLDAEALTRRYCVRHGYERVVDTTRRLPNTTAAWEKIVTIGMLLARPDVTSVMWLDDDAFVSDPKRTIAAVLSHPDHADADLFLANDEDPGQRAHALNTGVMLIRNTDWAKVIGGTCLRTIRHVTACADRTRGTTLRPPSNARARG